jgi:radical SAM protein with 4Fe4S-binding SPASM domain
MISTNGTLLDDDMRNWLHKYKKTVIVAFSIDGTAESHNLSRNNSFYLVIKNIPFFLENWPNQPAKMTVGAENIPYVAESVISLENLGVIFTANVVLENIWGNEDNKKKLLHTYAEQLDILVDFYSKNPQLIPVFPMLRSFPLYMGLPDEKWNALPVIERYCGAGHEMRVVDIDGQIYPCHRFLPWVTNRFTPIPENVNCQKVWEPAECKNCKVFSSCPTCAGFNWEINGNTGNRTTFHCESFKLELKASAKLESLKLKQITPSVLKTMSAFERKEMKMKMAVIFDILNNRI